MDTAGYLFFLRLRGGRFYFILFVNSHMKGIFSMKQTVKIWISLVLAVVLLLCTVSCAEKADATGLWENATYLSDTTLGDGANTVKVELTVDDQTIVFTVKTDKPTLGEALYEHQLINDASFFDTCNGIKADWDKDQAYWAFYVGDEMAMYGVGDEKAITTGEPTYKIVYTK